MALNQLFDDDQTYIGNTFHRIPVDVARGRGSFLYDRKGKKYLDFLTGVAVLPLGHAHPEVKKAITAQAGRYVHLSNHFVDDNQVELARMLVENSFADKVFFVNSGAEATEVAIKLARKWATRHKSPKAMEIVCMEQSFHGRTMGALTVTGQPRFHQGIGPMLGGVRYVPYDNIGALRAAIGRKTAAVIVEPIQCEGGIVIPQFDYLHQLKHHCKKENVLLIADEIQTGLGRTGKFLACEHALTTPDIALLGKSLGGGLPLSAVLTTDAIAQAFGLGDHGTTMGGNPVACAAGRAQLAVILKKNLVPHAHKLGEEFRNRLLDLRKKYPRIENVRALGLIVGFDFEGAAELVDEALKNGLIINKVQEKTVRFVPPLNLAPAEMKLGLAILEKSIKKVCA